MTEEKCIDAIHSGDSEAVMRLVRSGVDINTRFYDGYTLLHLAVLYGNDSIAKDVLEYWTEAGGDVNVKTNNGSTPLHLAVTVSLNSTVVAALCRAGAALHAHDSYGETPLELAICRGYDDVADCLRLAGAHAHEEAPALAAGTDAESVRLCYTRIQGSTDQSGSSSATACLTSRVQTSATACLTSRVQTNETTKKKNPQTNSICGDWLSDYIQELLETYDQPCHEELRKWIIDDIPWLYGINLQAEVDPLMAARSLEIHRRLIEMSLTDYQLRQLLMLMKKHQPVKEDDELEFAGYPSGDEENDTDDETDGQHLERTEPSLQEQVTELEAFENRISLHINHD